MASSEEDGANGGASEASDEREATRKRRRGFLATFWLTFYNIAMTAGWLVLAIAMVRFYMEKGTHRGLYKSIQKTLKFFQTFALLEVRIVPTSVIVTGVQVSSRIFMVWLITHSIKPIQNEESVVLFLVAWTVTEITRYSFYTFSLLDHLPYFIKWFLTVLCVLILYQREGGQAARVPSCWGVLAQNYRILNSNMASQLIFLCFLFFNEVFPQLYFHMLRQRRKVLHGEVIVEKDD
uniref:Very-long-chain (3R)-3-hydroxyacyl-CoA dehydratase n=1 Tax=Propithecus coquereli TaxID=379532 RepID=A0A2K6FKM2_PROCO